MAGSAKFDKSLFTANFKRDYVAYSAIGMFFLIVAAEVILAVSIPAYFVRSNLWDLQIAQQGLLSDFDDLRSRCNRFAGKTPDVTEENNILLWNLNLMSNYIRVNQKRLGWDDIRSLTEDLKQMRQVHNRLARGKAFNQPRALNTGRIRDALRLELVKGGQK